MTKIPRQPKFNPPTKDWSLWLNEEPEIIDYNLDGSTFIPILIVERQLTELDPHWSTENFKFRTFIVNDKVYVSSSIELVVTYAGTTRRLVGASTYEFKSDENLEYGSATLENAEPTSLSESLKNGVKRLGKRFGSELNDRVTDVIRNGKKKPARSIENSVKNDADEKIMEMYKEAVANGNTQITTMLERRYNIKKS